MRNGAYCQSLVWVAAMAVGIGILTSAACFPVRIFQIIPWSVPVPGRSGDRTFVPNTLPGVPELGMRYDIKRRKLQRRDCSASTRSAGEVGERPSGRAVCRRQSALGGGGEPWVAVCRRLAAFRVGNEVLRITRGKGCKALPTTAPPPPKSGGDFGKCQGKGDTEPGATTRGFLS